MFLESCFFIRFFGLFQAFLLHLIEFLNIFYFLSIHLINSPEEIGIFYFDFSLIIIFRVFIGYEMQFVICRILFSWKFQVGTITVRYPSNKICPVPDSPNMVPSDSIFLHPNRSDTDNSIDSDPKNEVGIDSTPKNCS